jgi:fatty-acyl-CoA synthase
VLHTINPRLQPTQLAWMVNHAEDSYLFFDLTFLPLVEAIAGSCGSIRGFVAMAARDAMPANSSLRDLLCYEDLIDEHGDAFVWPEFDENTASSLCYTSGTTGHPRGVLYSHRSTLLHTFASALPDAFSLSARDSVLAVVPMFHANAWGLPYLAPMVGARVVFPGPRLDGPSLYDLIESERVTCSAGVPTIWQALLAHVQANGLRFSTMRRTTIGGSACPPAMLRTFRETYGVEPLHAWGMTEMSPLGTVCSLKETHAALDDAARHTVLCKQGRSIFGVDMKVVGEDGHELPWDGTSFGELLVRGPWVVREYFRDEGGSPLVTDAEGRQWFPTHDVSTIDADGYMQITDRSKDVIKSGGEWISSIEIENIAMSHPAVAMAACIGVQDPKWGERPLLIAVRRPQGEVDREQLLAHYTGKVARWQVPDDVVFVDAIPLGATGKMQKHALRERFKDHALPNA